MWFLRARNAVLVVLAAVLGQQLQPASAAYNRPADGASLVTADSREISRSSAFTSKGNLLDPSLNDEDIDKVMQDFDKRIDPEFKIPKEIRNNVGFWLRIYSLYTTQHVVIYDSRHPEAIYEVLDFRDVAEKAKSRLIYEITVKNRIAKRVKAYRAAFERLKNNPKPRKPTLEEKNILAALKNTPHRHSIGEFARHLRTQTGQRDNIIKGLAAAEPFFPKMEQIFSQLQIPPQLVRLSLVESSFNMNAISRAGASGVWQFMPESGKEYLMIDNNSDIDERISPLKATVAAGKLLKRNYRILQNWALAITSYNHGTSNLRTVAAKRKTPVSFSHLAYLFEPCPSKKKSRIGWASRNYYAEFLAVLHAESYRHLLYGNFKTPPEIHALSYVRLDRSQTSVDFAMNHGVSLKEFQRLNPDVGNARKNLPKGFLVAIPTNHDFLSPLVSGRRVAVVAAASRRR